MLKFSIAFSFYQDLELKPCIERIFSKFDYAQT